MLSSRNDLNIVRQIIFAGTKSLVIAFLAVSFNFGQKATPSPTPTPDPDVLLNGYRVTSSTEIGWRWRRVSGNENKYRSDLNYDRGVRLFDTNFLLETDSGKGRYFDSLLVSTSGWGSDPSGFTRVNVEKTGAYTANFNLRRVQYFNNLANHALNEHNQDTAHTFGDFDFTLFPQSESLRILFGASISGNRGIGTFTTRANSDEFMVDSRVKNDTEDYHVGVEGTAGGFDLGLTQGFRQFNDDTSYSSLVPNPGNNPTNTAALATFTRLSPTKGRMYFTQGYIHRMFAKKLDFTGRIIYSSLTSRMGMNEQLTGRDNSNNVVILDQFDITSQSKRPQTRGDIGFTYMVSDKFRLSNTFTFDQFAVNGGEAFFEAVYKRTNAGAAIATVFTGSNAYRVDSYRRFVNTAEADYQVNNRFGFHIGYRYTHRNAGIVGIDLTTTSAPSATNPAFSNEEETNSTNTVIGGIKIKPGNNWVIFSDFEHGTADNVFTRVENYDFTNFRIRTRVTVNKMNLNLSAITKDNTNPTTTLTGTSTVDFVTNVKSRVYSGAWDYSPNHKVDLSVGYTYRHLTSYTPIILPINNVSTRGFSQFFVRDRYAYVDVAVKPFDRLSLFASYRFNNDKGQGSRSSTVIQNIITSYPMKFVTPEFRAAIRISRNVDWNIGYQYFDYRDTQTPVLNYKAKLPYTSLRIYFGRDAAAR